MHETESEIANLQKLLDDSYSKAGSHLLSIHKSEWQLSAPEVSASLRNVCVINLATVNEIGQPRIAPVDGLFLGGIFWFGSSNESARFKHIRKNTAVSAAYTVGDEVSIVVHGSAHEIDSTTGEFERLHDYCREIYGLEYDSYGYWGNAPFAWIEAEKMYAIKMQHGTTGN
jgi:uncharacterized pyridoxamine 5'-phosphate oxidase family protein